MVTAQVPLRELRAWGQLAAAIELVARGRYPEVEVANIEYAARLALALRSDADRLGIDLDVTAGPPGGSGGVVARRR